VHETVGAKFSLHMELSADIHACTTAALITASVMVKPRVPRGGQILGTVGLVDIHLHAVYAKWTAGLWTLPVTVVVPVCVRVIWADGVEVVVDTPFGTTIVHVEFHISAQKVE
jgi:hypothetical protein